MDDEYQVNLLRSQAKDDRFDLDFIDYSVKEPWDTPQWRAHCADRIAQTSTLIVMIGPGTYQRPAVLWEIEEAYRQGKRVIGVRIYKDAQHPIPAPMVSKRAKIVRWNVQEINDAIYE